jgi:hypothetical protein
MAGAWSCLVEQPGSLREPDLRSQILKILNLVTLINPTRLAARCAKVGFWHSSNRTFCFITTRSMHRAGTRPD